jgi:predicted GNAT superfamily acetyltransferase
MFSEMTGVRRAYRRRGIATALKVIAVGFARARGVSMLRTVHDARSSAAIKMNLRLGYVPTPSFIDDV